jgi:hypothetical protein
MYIWLFQLLHRTASQTSWSVTCSLSLTSATHVSLAFKLLVTAAPAPHCIADFLVSHLQPLIDLGYKLTSGSAESLTALD